ncbi:MAG: glycosyltransferase family 2 protein [Nocardioides sp.]
MTDTRHIVASHYDGVPALRQTLASARAGLDYAAAYSEDHPLVTVRIATYDRAEILFDRTLPSVLDQTYPHLEIIIVGDGASEETARRARLVTDERVRFVNLPHRGVYPEDPHKRWLVAGSPAMNHGAQLARGRWIAPLDDDDTFTPDHVERLLTLAREGRFEMVYGQMDVVRDPPEQHLVIGTYPPAYSQFGFQSALYVSALRFFEYDTASWVLDEPGDWNLCRRMLAAGVLIGYTPHVVTTLYPAGPR